MSVRGTGGPCVTKSFSHTSICLLTFLESSFIRMVRSPVFVTGQVSGNTGHSLGAKTLWTLLSAGTAALHPGFRSASLTVALRFGFSRFLKENVFS